MKKNNSLGNFVLVLHSHLPFVVNHGKWPHGMEWLFEAASETYIPILNALNELLEEGKNPKMSISVTPVLAEQLSHPSFVKEFLEFLDIEIQRAEEDIELFEGLPHERNYIPLAYFWRDFYINSKRDFIDKYDKNLVAGFSALEKKGVLDIITCGATHGYFPLLGLDSNIQAQVKMAVKTHEKHFGRRPRGIWLPECAYRPRYAWKPPVRSSLGDQPYMRKGEEEILDENGLEYFIIDSSLVDTSKAVGIYHGRFESIRDLMKKYEEEMRHKTLPEGPHSIYDVHKTISSMDSGRQPVAVFARDVETSMQVWSSETGYPGNEWYLEFHKKHYQSGHRYWRVTSGQADLGQKVMYEPDRIEGCLYSDAVHFVASIRSSLYMFKEYSGYNGTLTAPFDSELFGHWWFEGPRFLKKVLSMLSDDHEINLMTCAEIMDHEHPSKVISLPEGSWGAGGNHYVWFNDQVDWMWEHIYEDEYTMRRLAEQHAGTANELLSRIMKQMARELFLLESSDWQFLISTFSANDYSIKRFMEHHQHFNQLKLLAEKLVREEPLNQLDHQYLDELRRIDYLFDEELIDLSWYTRD